MKISELRKNTPRPGKRKAHKPGYSLEQHKAAGRDLRMFCGMLSKLACDLSHYYPLSHRVTKQAEKAVTQADFLACELDNIVFREQPDLSTKELANIYYGKSDKDENQR